MIQLVTRFKNYLRLRKLRKESKKPTLLPVGLTEFHKFCDDIIELSGKYADRDSMMYAIASNIIHMKHDLDSVPKDYLVKTLRKAAANQVASQVFNDIRTRQQEAAEQAKQASTPSADTGNNSAVDGEKPGL